MLKVIDNMGSGADAILGSDDISATQQQAMDNYEQNKKYCNKQSNENENLIMQRQEARKKRVAVAQEAFSKKMGFVVVLYFVGFSLLYMAMVHIVHIYVALYNIFMLLVHEDYR